MEKSWWFLRRRKRKREVAAVVQTPALVVEEEAVEVIVMDKGPKNVNEMKVPSPLVLQDWEDLHPIATITVAVVTHPMSDLQVICQDDWPD